jgi:signal transduction histidine kinase
MVVPVSTDGAAVIRILSALITHALQSTVRCQASLRVERKDDEVGWVLTVNGLGIERALRESVGNGTGTPAVGSSLDLALAHRRAAALGGRIVMLSEPGASRSYALCLPSQQPPRH